MTIFRRRSDSITLGPPEPDHGGDTLDGEQRTLNLGDREDLSYIEALADNAPRLSSRIDMLDPLTDFWRSVVRGLIAEAKKPLADPPPASTEPDPAMLDSLIGKVEGAGR